MNDQERQIISDIFRRLEQTAGQARDAEAERFIADKVRQQPYAPYAMAQALYVQEEALKSLNEQVEQLKAENGRLQQQGSGGGLLSFIFGGGGRQQQPSFSRGAQQGGPWGNQQPGYGQQPQQPGYAPQQGYPPQQAGPWGGQQAAPAGGGFLRGALTTAAGVAGGMVVGNALMNAFSGGHHSTLGSLSNADMASLGGDAFSGGGFGGESGLSNAAFDQGGGGFDQGGFGGDAGLSEASFDDGGDFGGGDDSSWT